MKIHENANLRSKLAGYRHIRREFASIMNNLWYSNDMHENDRHGDGKPTGISAKTTDKDETAELIIALLKRSNPASSESEK